MNTSPIHARCLTRSALLLASLFLSLGWAASAFGGIDASNTSLDYEGADPWNTGDSFIVGKPGMTVGNGSSIVSNDVTMFVDSRVTVHSPGSTWSISGTLTMADRTFLHIRNYGEASVGSIVIPSSSTVLLENGTLNIGEMLVDSKQALPQGTGTVNFTSVLNVSKSFIVPSGLVVNVPSGVVVTANGDLIVQGDLNANITNNGDLVLLGVTLGEPVINPAGSAITVLNNSKFDGLVSGAGGIFGPGTATFNGGYNPGDSPAVVGVENSIAFGSGNTLGIELGGLTAGEFDQLQVGGDATLDGTLEVSLLGPFAPEAGQEFLILEAAGNVSGQFATLGEGGLVGNFGGQDLFITYAAGNGNDVALYTSPVPEPSALALAGLGLMGLTCLGRQQRRRPAA